mmetsp:Transcript_144314/g.448109  ORF Transcript_144314/g.448109 Transcript_144314/m.448109 type:complete len:236 (+) Transcript_144314:47-754(+)
MYGRLAAAGVGGRGTEGVPSGAGVPLAPLCRWRLRAAALMALATAVVALAFWSRAVGGARHPRGRGAGLRHAEAKFGFLDAVRGGGKSVLKGLKDSGHKADDLFPAYVHGSMEYYDNGTVIAGSWHWTSCNFAHMRTCRSLGFAACCCEEGFAYAAKNAGATVGKAAATATAAGAAGGAVVTGVLMGGDLGASAAAGAASGAASGTASGALRYAMEGGGCTAKEGLDKRVREHLS